MNTRLGVVFWGVPALIAEKVFENCIQKVEQSELVLSRYHKDSELFNLNRKALNKPVQVSSGLWNAIQLSGVYYEKTLGYFDIRFGKLYDQLKSGVSPKGDSVLPFNETVVLNESLQTVKFCNENISFDFGGVGKGMALEAIASYIDKAEIQNAFISFGGSSILTRGSHPHGDYWPFSLVENKETNRIWQLNNHCISVSRTKRDVGNGVSPHIYNTVNNQTAASVNTVVIQNNNAIEAEVLSTALVAAPFSMHAAIAKQFEKCTIDIFGCTTNFPKSKKIGFRYFTTSLKGVNKSQFFSKSPLRDLGVKKGNLPYTYIF
jgi:thiamine biosynthesis lipoprotein ApbE